MIAHCTTTGSVSISQCYRHEHQTIAGAERLAEKKHIADNLYATTSELQNAGMEFKTTTIYAVM